jgi:hypothetical protein
MNRSHMNFQRLASLCLLIFGVLSFASTAHASPISITSCAQLELIGAGNPAYAATSSYILNGPSNVIDCSAIHSGNGFFRIQDFTGTLNGNGNTITGLYENYPSNADVGLFEDIESGGLVENLTIASSTIVGISNVGVVAGILNSGTIQNVTVTSGTVTGTSTAQNIGGLVGHNNGTIATSSAAISVQGSTYVGGLVGENSGTINGSWATGSVVSTNANAENIGGFSGADDSGTAVTNSYATGNVTATGTNSSNIGGFAGLEQSGISGSYALGNVTAGASSQDVGGFIGDYAAGPITTSYASGNVSAGNASQAVGGFVGNADGQSISFSNSSGIVSGGNGVGGFAGYADIPISDSFSSSPVTIVGNGTGVGPQNVGGFAGTADSTSFTDSYETGSVSISGTFTSAVSNVGGFDGTESGTMTNTYAVGNVTVPAGSQTIGGYAGFISGVVTNSFSTGTVTAPQPGSNEIGGYVGNNNFASLVNDAWYSNSGGDGTNAEGDDQGFGLPNIPLLATLGYGTDEATSSNFYTVTEPVYAFGNGGWDFNSVWIPHLHSYPTLGVSSSTFIISASGGTGGSLTPNGSVAVARNASQSFTITASTGYSIQLINVDGSSVSATSSYTFTHVYTPHLISVIFIPNPVATVTPPVVTTGGGGGGSGGSIPNQVSNLLGENNYSGAITLIKQYKNLFSTSTKLTVTQVSVSSSPTTMPTATSTAGTFTHNLSYGSRRVEVKALQEYLNAHGFIVASTGSGSPGNETTYFGKALRTALAKFQKANGIHPASGYFGPATRKYINAHS